MSEEEILAMLEIQYLAAQELQDTLHRFPTRQEVADKVEHMLRPKLCLVE
jgi:hypothetical protein